MRAEFVARRGSDRKDVAEDVGRNGGRRRRRRRHHWRWKKDRATSCTFRCGRRDFRFGRSSGASSMPTSELGARLREALLPIEPKLPTSNLRTMQTMVDQAVSPRRFMVILLGGFAAICAGTGVAWDLRGDLVFSEPEDAGDWDSDGAGGVGGDVAEEHLDADVVAGGDRCRWWDCGFVDSGAGAERDVVWGDADGSGHVRCAWW